MRDFAAVFAGRADVDERLARLRMRERVGKKGADFLVEALGRHGIGRARVARLVARQRTALGLPLVAPAIEEFHLGVAEKPEGPQGIRRPPVGLVAVENHRGIGRDAIPAADLGKFFGSDVVALRVVLQVAAPVDVHRAGNVARVVEEHVLVALDNADGRIVEMLLQPGAVHQDLRVRILGKLGIHGLAKLEDDRPDSSADARFLAAPKKPFRHHDRPL